MANVKKPIYKKWWFILIIVILLISIFSKNSGESNQSSEEEKQATKTETKQVINYTPVETKQLLDDLTSNALKAKEKYKDKDVEISGVLDDIDASGKYITVIPSKEDILITKVQAYIKNDDQKKIVMELSKGEKIVVKGKITDVGELMGYSVDIDDISKKK